VSAVATRSVVAALRAVTAADRVIDEAVALAAFALDGVAPRWVARPSSVGQLAAVMTVAAEEGLAVAPRGAGAALDLGAPPARLDLVVDLAGLDAIVEHNADDLTVTVQAGLSLHALNRYLQAHRQFLPLDPVGDAHTVGGIAATGISGPLRFRYGTMRDLLLGVRFVQADGVLTWGGSKVVKSVTGYDIPKLMVGALGTLGVLAELTLRLHSRPDVERTWLVALPSAGAAQTLVASILDSTLQPNRIELLDEHALRVAALPVSPMAVLVSFGSVEEAVAEQGDRLTRLARHAGGEARAAAGEWTTTADHAVGDGRTTLRVGSLPSRLASTFETLTRALTRVHGARSAASAHAGIGVWRVLIDGGTPETIATLVAQLREGVAEHGGYVVVTGGPAAVRRRVDPWGPIAPDALALMRSIKATFDPDGRLNPGRFVSGL
jgi:glycolate oxidase FAD binding subunit